MRYYSYKLTIEDYESGDESNRQFLQYCLNTAAFYTKLQEVQATPGLLAADKYWIFRLEVGHNVEDFTEGERNTGVIDNILPGSKEIIYKKVDGVIVRHGKTRFGTLIDILLGIDWVSLDEAEKAAAVTQAGLIIDPYITVPA